jgi:hypothetical protein
MENSTSGGTPAATQKAPFQLSARTIWPDPVSVVIPSLLLDGLTGLGLLTALHSGHPLMWRVGSDVMCGFPSPFLSGADSPQASFTCDPMSRRKHGPAHKARRILSRRIFVSRKRSHHRLAARDGAK